MCVEKLRQLLQEKLKYLLVALACGLLSCIFLLLLIELSEVKFYTKKHGPAAGHVGATEHLERTEALIVTKTVRSYSWTSHHFIGQALNRRDSHSDVQEH